MLSKALLGLLGGMMLFGALSAQQDDRPPVDTALVLASDVSASINNERYQLQKTGTANALTHPEVLDAIAAGENHAIAVTYIEWSNADEQRVVVPWTRISSADEAESFAGRLLDTGRSFNSQTSISEAMFFAIGLFDACPWPASKKVIDVSGDGANNIGRPITDVKPVIEANGLTLNGLPIEEGGEAGIADYYRDWVTAGPLSFTLVVGEYRDFGRALRSKLVQEIVALPTIYR